MVIKATVEDRVLAIQERKRQLVSAAFAGIKYDGKNAEEQRRTRINEIREIFGL